MDQNASSSEIGARIDSLAEYVESFAEIQGHKRRELEDRLAEKG